MYMYRHIYIRIKVPMYRGTVGFYGRGSYDRGTPVGFELQRAIHHGAPASYFLAPVAWNP